MYDKDWAKNFFNPSTGSYAIPLRTYYHKPGESRLSSATWYVEVDRDDQVHEMDDYPRSWEESNEFRKIKMMNDLHDEEISEVEQRIKAAKAAYEAKYGTWLLIK